MTNSALLLQHLRSNLEDLEALSALQDAFEEEGDTERSEAVSKLIRLESTMINSPFRLDYVIYSWDKAELKSLIGLPSFRDWLLFDSITTGENVR